MSSINKQMKKSLKPFSLKLSVTYNKLVQSITPRIFDKSSVRIFSLQCNFDILFRNVELEIHGNSITTFKFDKMISFINFKSV